MIIVYLLIGLVAGAGIAYYFYTRRKGPKYFAACEYWVYLPDEKMPVQDEIMTRMIAQNPHGKGARSPIGPKEGILFSDIRLDMTLVLKAKNPHVFRPDLFSESTEPTAELLEALAEAKSLVKIRYVSEQPLTDDRHLQFLPHLADATASVGNGLAVYDVVLERLMTAEQLHQELKQDADATRPDFHLRVIWCKDEGSGHAETKGLVKKGFPELVTADAMLDNRLLVTEVLMQAAKQIWADNNVPEEVTVSAYMDEFKLLLAPEKEGRQTARILRIQAT